MNQSKNHAFYIFAFSVLAALILPVLFADGMFMDGIQYACVSKNLAHGWGSFWFPYLSQTWWKADLQFFMEHPPLVYGLQSVFFKVFGDGMYTERIYSLLTALITAWLIIRTWQLVFNDDKEQKSLGWLPVLLWIIIPVCFWSYQNNMQENTMGIFTLASVFCCLKGLVSKRGAFFFLSIAGVFVFLATFSKGLPGAFSLGAVIIYAAVFRNISWLKALGYSFYVLFIPAFIYLCLVQYPPAHKSLSFYFFERLLGRINEEGLVSNRLYILGKLFLEIIVPVGVCLLTILVCRWRKLRPVFETGQRRWMIFFLLLGLAGSVPLMLTPVQRGFYLVPSFPFFGIAFAIVLAPYVLELFRNIKDESRAVRVFRISSLLIFISILVFFFTRMGKPGRDANAVSDARAIADLLPENVIAGCTDKVYNSWSFQFYLLRYGDISIGPESIATHPFFIMEKGSTDSLPGGYSQLLFEGKEYKVYVKK